MTVLTSVGGRNRTTATRLFQAFQSTQRLQIEIKAWVRIFAWKVRLLIEKLRLQDWTKAQSISGGRNSGRNKNGRRFLKTVQRWRLMHLHRVVQQNMQSSGAAAFRLILFGHRIM